MHTIETIEKTCTLAVLLGLCASSALAQETDSAAPWGTEGGTGELGFYWGMFFPSSKHELYDPDTTPFQRLEEVTPELGLRAAYFPARMLGLELEGGILPSQTRTTSDAVNLFAVRAHAMLLAPTEGIVPFLLVGGGALAIASDEAALGSDLDPEFHVGIGAKVYALRNVAVRLDVRDTFTMGRGAEERAQHWEALLGLSIVVGRSEPPPPPPAPPSPPPSPPPPPPPSPPPPPPPLDTDGDGVPDREDKCSKEPETKNTFEDSDGCPDELPGAVKKLPDVIEAVPATDANEPLLPR